MNNAKNNERLIDSEMNELNVNKSGNLDNPELIAPD